MIPKLNRAHLKRLRGLGFEDLAFEILRLFITETDVPKEKLRSIVKKCYKGFDESDIVVPLVVLDEDSDDDDDDEKKKSKSKKKISQSANSRGGVIPRTDALGERYFARLRGADD